MNIRKVGVSAMVVAMMSSMVVPVEAATYNDINSHFAKSSIEKLSGYGAITGYNGKFRPNDHITRGEMAVVLANLMKYQTRSNAKFNDLDNGFYRDAIQKVNAAGVMNGDGYSIRPKAKITRQEAMVMLANAYGLEPNPTAIYSFKDADKVASWARGSVGALISKGFVSGSNGMLKPTDYITRGELVAIIDRMTGLYVNEKGSVKANTGSNAVIVAPNTEISGGTIGGNVIITEGAKGDVTIRDTRVNGTVIVPNNVSTLKLRGSAKINEITSTSKQNVTIDGSSTTKVNKLTATDTKTLKISGDFGEVMTAKTDNANLNAENVNIDKLTLTSKNARANVTGLSEISKVVMDREAEGSTLSLSKDVEAGKVDVYAENSKLTINGETGSINVHEEAEGTTIQVSSGDKEVSSITIDAEDVTVSGSGGVKAIYVNADNTTISVKDAVVYVGSGVENTIVGGKKVSGGKTVNSSSVDDDTEWDDVSIKEINVVNEKEIEVTLKGATIETALKKNNFSVEAKKSSVDDPVISSVSTKELDKKKNIFYTIKFNDKDALEDDKEYTLFIELPNGDTIKKTFNSGDLGVDDEYPELSSIDVERTDDDEAEFSFRASISGKLYYLVKDVNYNGSVSKSDIVNGGEKVSIDRGDNTIKIKRLESGKAYKLYVVTEDIEKSSVYGYYSIKNDITSATSSSISSVNYDGSSKFTVTLVDELNTTLGGNNFTLVGPNGTMNISKIDKTGNKTYVIQTSSTVVGGDYTVKIKYDNGTTKEKSVTVVLEEAKVPIMSQFTVERVSGQPKKLSVKLNTSDNGYVYVIEGNKTAAECKTNGTRLTLTKGNVTFDWTLSNQDSGFITLVSVSADGLRDSGASAIAIPPFSVGEGENNTGGTGGSSGSTGGASEEGGTGSSSGSTGSAGGNTGGSTGGSAGSAGGSAGSAGGAGSTGSTGGSTGGTSEEGGSTGSGESGNNGEAGSSNAGSTGQ